MLLRHARALPTVAVAAVVAATFVLAPAAAQASDFQDVSGASYEPAVQALVDEEIIFGCGDGRFCPHDDMTRAQMAALLVRALELPEADDEHFGDIHASTHRDDINALAEAGITNGCTEDAFCPNASVTRAEMATLLSNAFEPDETSEVYFDDVGGVHAGAVDRLADAGIAAGCGDPLTAFCPHDPVLRRQAAPFVARALDLVDRVEVSSLETRREQQAEIDAERQRQQEEEEAARRAAERDQMWEDLAQCESGGNWSINTGNGYYGGLQFSLSSWQWVGGSGYPHQNSRAEQIYRAEILLERQGWNAWPSCSRQLGYR